MKAAEKTGHKLAEPTKEIAEAEGSGKEISKSK
jgi:hypothetical protein